MGKTLIVAGLLIVGVGVLVSAGVFPGRLPGDISFRRGNVTVYLPIASCIAISLVLTLVMTIFRR